MRPESTELDRRWRKARWIQLAVFAAYAIVAVPTALVFGDTLGPTGSMVFIGGMIAFLLGSQVTAALVIATMSDPSERPRRRELARKPARESWYDDSRAA